MSKVEVGDRVRMDTSRTGWLGYPIPDLGVGTVVATEGGGLFEGWYVEVEWDQRTHWEASRPSIAALVIATEEERA